MSRDVTYDWFGRAVALCELGRLDDAEDALRQGLHDEPDDPVAHAMLAVVLAELDRGGEAVAAAESAIALAPDLALAHAARAQAFLSLERLKESEDSATEAIRLDPDEAESHAMLAAILIARGQWEAALAAADRALSLEPESESARGLRAYALAMTQGRPDWAEAAEGTLAVAPVSSVAHALVGHAHLARGGEREAVERFREALRLDPANEAAQAGLAEAMKASHPLFKPLFRFFMWQERLSTGAKVALTIGPLFVVRLLRSQADNPVAIALIILWLAFVVVTWAAVPIANVALRLSPVGRAVLPSDQSRSSLAFLAFIGAALLCVVLAIVWSGGFAGGAFTFAFLAFSVGSAHGLGPTLRRAVYAAAIAAGLVAFVGDVLIASGLETAGAVLVLAAIFASLALIWTVRLG